MKRRVLLSAIVGITSALTVVPGHANEHAYDLMMTGSELQFCRSTHLTQCNPESVSKFSKDIARQSAIYKLSMERIERAMNADLWHSSRQVMRYELNIFLTEFAKKVGTKLMRYEQLINRWKTMTITHGKNNYSGHYLFLRLSDNERHMIFDFLEETQADSFGRALPEQVNLADDKYPNSLAQAKLIVEQARLVNGNQKPNLLLVTAGFRDTFKNIDAYQAFFSELNTNTQWLPTDKALNTLQVDGVSCSKLSSYREKFLNSYQRRIIYKEKVAQLEQACRNPKQVKQMIEQADGIIFVGDSPKLLRESFVIYNKVISEPLRIIKQQMDKKKLFVAALGSVSRAMAGRTPEQPIIISGSSENAMRFGAKPEGKTVSYCEGTQVCKPKETIYSQGGIGLFDFSPIDTHFSKQGHFVRLANAALATKQQFALGLDHDTALLVANKKQKLTLRVSGLSGVTLLQHKPQEGDVKNNELNNFQISYFTPGDVLSVDKGQVSVVYPEWKPPVKSYLNEPEQFRNLLFSDNFYRFSQQACLIKDTQWFGFAGRKKEYKLSLAKQDDTSLRMGGLKVGNGFKLYCSYHALSLNMLMR